MNENMVTLGSDSARGHILKDKTRGQAVPPPLIKDSVVTGSSLSAEQEMQERYRLIAKATNDAVWDWDLISNHVLWNDVLTRSYGYRSEDIVPTGEWWLARIHPDDRARVESSILTIIDGDGTAWTEEYRFRRGDDDYAEVLDRGHVIRDHDGRATRVIGAMLDLTQIRSAANALRQSEERFRTILETIEAAFAILEIKFDERDRPVDYRFVEVNPAFEKQVGVDLLGKWVTEYAPDLEPFWFQIYGRVALTGEPASFENYAKAFARWFDVRAVRVGDPDDRQIAIIFNDVTERHNAQERLRTSEAVARDNIERVQLALAAGAIIGTWHWDLIADRFTVDDGFAHAFGLPAHLDRSDLRLDEIVTTVHPDDRDGLMRAIEEVLARGGAYAHQYRVRRADGKYYWIEANGRVEHDPNGEPVRFPGVLLDVEERRAVEAERDRALAALRALNDTLEQRVAERTDELMESEEKLRQSQKMEAVGQLTGGLAHDFNNLLAGISGALELMARRIDQGRSNEIEKYILAAQGAAKRAASLTHRLLAFSRRQTLEPRPTDVNMLISNMLELIRHAVGPGVRVETRGIDRIWTTLVDAGQLESSLLNLCINARDAMPDGGSIIIETCNQHMDDQVATALEMPAGEYLVLKVTDSGVGMEPDVLAKAFDPFFTTKPIGRGTGLGLSMIYGFAKQSGGQVRIESEPGHGSRIFLYLPRHEGQPVSDQHPPERSQHSYVESGGTILIVDDEPTVRMLLRDALADQGYTLIEAADSIAGLKLLRSDINIDLLITDVGLPGGMNGRQMADAALENRPGLKVLFITGYAETTIFGKGDLAPGMRILTKPFTVHSLSSRVRHLLAGEPEDAAPESPLRLAT